MKGFRYFFEQTQEQEANIKATLLRVPKKHTDLLRGYKIKWHCNNVLDGDNKHVGIVNPNNKTITIAAPYRYSREFAFLHELAHKVWEAYVMPNPKLVNKWKQIIKKTKTKIKQNAEELFCHGFAAAYAKNPPTIHYHPEWVKFIKSI